MPMVNITLAVVNKREHMSIDGQIPLPRYATASRPTPMTPTQRAEPWDDMVAGESETPNTGEVLVFYDQGKEVSGWNRRNWARHKID
ncbi:hypothetical protein IG631_07157 [Alternaria alternata]|nr:hypothetical protein IG631_07157 [Alternaria alternata]